jgi:hypothetical protein
LISGGCGAEPSAPASILFAWPGQVEIKGVSGMSAIKRQAL